MPTLACGGAQAASETPEKRATGVSADACHAQPAQGIRDVWTWDFLESTTITGVKLRWLNVVDEYTRQCLTIKVRRSIKSEHAIDTLAELFAMYGVPKRLRCDNGPEFISKAVE